MKTLTTNSIAAGFTSLIVFSAGQLASAAPADKTVAPHAPSLAGARCSATVLPTEVTVFRDKTPETLKIQVLARATALSCLTDVAVGPQDLETSDTTARSETNKQMQQDLSKTFKGKVVDSVVALVRSVQMQRTPSVPQGYILTQPIKIEATTLTPSH